MNSTKERNYVLSLAVILVLLIIGCIFSYVVGFIDVVNNNSINNNIFELIYITFHFIVIFVCLAFCIAYLRGNSYHIFKNMMYKYKTDVISKPAMIIMGVFNIISLATGIYFSLVLANLGLPDLNFPIFLKLILVNTPFTVFVVTTYFMCYPLIYKK